MGGSCVEVPAGFCACCCPAQAASRPMSSRVRHARASRRFMICMFDRPTFFPSMLPCLVFADVDLHEYSTLHRPALLPAFHNLNGDQIGARFSGPRSTHIKGDGG